MTDDDVDKQFVTAANVVIGKELNATSPPDSVGINRTGLGELIYEWNPDVDAFGEIVAHEIGHGIGLAKTTLTNMQTGEIRDHVDPETNQTYAEKYLMHPFVGGGNNNLLTKTERDMYEGLAEE